MPRTVVLRHDLPDGSHHYDWLIEPADESQSSGPGVDPHDPDARVLIAWRLPAPPHESTGSTPIATRLPPHRRLYLDYQGPIAGDRGEVRLVASGRAEILADEPARFVARLTVGDQGFEVEGSPDAPPAWRLRFTPDRRRG